MTPRESSIYKNIDWSLVILVGCLMFFGLLNVVSATSNLEISEWFDWGGKGGKQLMWILICSFLGFLILNIESEFFTIYKNDVLNFLNREKHKFDLIIADPPYGNFFFTELMPKVSNILKKGGTFCYESKKEKIKCDINLKIKKYGNSQLIFWRKE